MICYDLSCCGMMKNVYFGSQQELHDDLYIAGLSHNHNELTLSVRKNKRAGSPWDFHKERTVITGLYHD